MAALSLILRMELMEAGIYLPDAEYRVPGQEKLQVHHLLAFLALVIRAGAPRAG